MATMYDPPHLGELIRESIEAEGWTVVETAERLGMSRVALSRVLNGHAGVSAVLLLALERIGWSDAEHWMRMQAIYDLARERRFPRAPDVALLNHEVDTEAFAPSSIRLAPTLSIC